MNDELIMFDTSKRYRFDLGAYLEMNGIKGGKVKYSPKDYIPWTAQIIDFEVELVNQYRGEVKGKYQYISVTYYVQVKWCKELDADEDANPTLFDDTGKYVFDRFAYLNSMNLNESNWIAYVSDFNVRVVSSTAGTIEGILNGELHKIPVKPEWCIRIGDK